MSARDSQHGFGLLYALLIVLGVAAAVTIGMLLLRAPTPAAQAQNQEENLAWADQAVAAFAAAHSRLPCPAASASGEEDCSAGRSKGWLPLRTLVGASGPGIALGPMRYMVYRGNGASTDLAQALNRYTPLDASGNKRRFDLSDTLSDDALEAIDNDQGTDYGTVHINGLDLCKALSDAANSAYAATAAHVADTSGNAYNVAYGIAAAGPSPGDDGRFDASNQDDTPTMESPARAEAAGYDDRVRVRAFGALAQSQDCAFGSDWTPTGTAPDSSAVAALDSLSNAVAVADAAKDAQEDNKSGTASSLVFAVTAETFDGIAVAMAGVALASSITTTTTASTALAGAIASCIASLGLSPTCELIGVYAAAVAAGATAITLSGVALGLTAGALAGTTAALALTIQAYDMAHETPADPELVDTSGMADAACDAVAPLQAQADKDAADAADARTNATNLQTELATWLKNPSDKIDYDSYNSIGAKGDLVTLTAEERADLNALLQAKLQAIRAEQTDYQTYLQAQASATALENKYLSAQAAITYLRGTAIPHDCDTGASDYLASRCTASRASLAALESCDKDSDGDGVDDINVQCAPDLYQQWQAALAVANADRSAWQASQAGANALHQPTMKSYIAGCSSPYQDYCSALLVLNQASSDTRRTYERIVALGLQAALDATNLEAQAATSAQQVTNAQQTCTDLRNLSLDPGSGGTYVPRWEGAGAIIESADARGTVGEDITQ